MKINKVASVCVLALSMALFSAGLAFATQQYDTYNTTAEGNKDDTSTQVGLEAAQATIGVINSRITSLTGLGGQSSGGGANGFGVWALGGYNYLENDKKDSKYDGSLTNYMVGLDKQIGSLLLGLSLGAEYLDLKTKFNSGKIRYDGRSIVPYVSYSFARDLVADGSFSYTWLDYRMKDTQGAATHTDDMDAYRMVSSLGLTKYMAFDKLLMSGRVGTLYVHEHQGAYKLNNTYYGSTQLYTWQGSLGVRGTYDLGAFKPYLGATYMQDFVKTADKDSDRWGADFDLGVGYTPMTNLSIGLTGIFGMRENLTKLGGLLNVRYDF